MQRHLKKNLELEVGWSWLAEYNDDVYYDPTDANDDDAAYALVDDDDYDDANDAADADGHDDEPDALPASLPLTESVAHPRKCFRAFQSLLQPDSEGLIIVL